jgi:protein translocase, SecG subunit
MVKYTVAVTGGRIMSVLRIIITVIYVLNCIGLAAIVLLQEGKQQGLGTIAGMADTYWGQNKGRSMEGKLVVITRIMAAAFIILSLVLNMDF